MGKILYKGAISPFPEYKIASSNIEKAVIIVPDHKKQLEVEKNLKEFVKYYKTDIPVITIPENQEIYDTYAQFKRNYALYKLMHSKNGFFITTEKALDIEISPQKEVITITKNQTINIDYLQNKLIEFGYVKEDPVENQGEFNFKGGMLSINIPFVGYFQIDTFGDEVENIFQVSKLLTRKSVNRIDIYPLYDYPVYYDEFFEIKFKDNSKIKLKEVINQIDIITIDTHSEYKQKIRFISIGKNTEVIEKLPPNFKVEKLDITAQLILKNEKLTFIPQAQTKIIPEVQPLKEGDYIIHEDYGIGIFRGIETKHIRGKEYDFMILEYANGEKINVSYLHFDKIHKYEFKGQIKLDTIGGTSWKNLKKKVKKSLEKIAKQLIKLYKERENTKRPPYNLNHDFIKQFEKSFPYVETKDQLKAINDIKKDMSSLKPMDRLICGDVGFGKTEVALRAAFICAINGKQTLILTPTTILSYQHFEKFKQRLEPFGIIVENLSRLKTAKQTKEILQKLEEGKIDVLVGTHKALSDKVKFKNLGLLIVDEEHRFGVKAKEKILMLKKDIDTIYLTATPIPRTLNMAISGLKDLSVINTPPEGRIETKTYVSKYSDTLIKQAILKELNRKGQVFYIHNKVQTIEQKANTLKHMFPDVEITYIHGKMKPKEIEKRLLNFINKKADILVATSIIETGIDIPSANTLIIERADTFGLAQLYHIRGRVGRGNIQAYCYLLLPEDGKITEDAQKRITTILKLTRPGSGLKVAMEDMKIRGAGNILGVEQSGYIKAVGFDMYVKLLKQSIDEAKGEFKTQTIIETDFESYIPESFINSPQERMNVYLSISKALSISDIDYIQQHLQDFYDGLPTAFKTYLTIEKIRKVASSLGIQKIKLSKISQIYFGNLKEEHIINLIKLLKVEKVHKDKIEFKLNPNQLNKFLEILINLEKGKGQKAL